MCIRLYSCVFFPTGNAHAKVACVFVGIRVHSCVVSILGSSLKHIRVYACVFVSIRVYSCVLF